MTDNQTNNLGDIFRRFPMLNVTKLAQSIGIPQSVLASYICGIKTPSDKRIREIETALHQLGDELKSVKL